jgi:hypothetical protein
MKASEYGIRNLKRIVAQLPEWTKEEADKYDNLRTMYTALVGQYNRYMNHVAKNVGGIYETPKSVEQAGEEVYEQTPEAIQQEAVAFLHKQLFETPTWLLDGKILNRINNPVSAELVSNVQVNVLNSLLSPARLYRLTTANCRFGEKCAYPLDIMMDDVKNGIWKELNTGKASDVYRRNLQKAHAEALMSLLEPTDPAKPTEGRGVSALMNVSTKNTDVVSVARAQLVSLQSQIKSAVPRTTDKMTRYHLQDVSNRIKQALDPKG